MTEALAVIDEAAYEAAARAELARWRESMLKGPSLLDRAARGLQAKINQVIPERVHAAVTAVIEKMTRAIAVGADLTTARPLAGASLSEREAEVRRRIAAYRAAAAAEGGVAGAGGFALALAEFPTLIATKIKLLFDIAALYGHDGARLSERLYILSIFQLAFSGADHRRDVLAAMAGWDQAAHPDSLDAVDWRRFQQEYRDYIDLAKMAQLIPLIGAPVGAVVNYRLLDRLGETAINAYRMRWFA
ncbi:MAG TPA: EcsC family protein [Phenylobacterium sp.]|nr:EcsC family protein [Phenylobacterium sp.]